MKKGFTLIEVLITVAIIAILTTIVLVSLMSFNRSKSLDADVDTIIEVVRQAQSQTLASKGSQQYGVHIASSTVTLFSGSTYSSSTSGNEVFTLLTSDLIVDTTLNGNNYDIVFNRLTGETSNYGTMTISSRQLNISKTVTIYKTGIIEGP